MNKIDKGLPLIWGSFYFIQYLLRLERVIKTQ